MKILWLSPFLLHPTTRGGQIRSLGILRELHRRHTVRFVSMQLPDQDSGVPRVSEYSAESRLIPHTLPNRRSPHFFLQLAQNIASRLPLTVARDISTPFRRAAAEELARGWHDVAICDFLSLAVNVAEPEQVVLFQHNVETQIWERMADRASNPLSRAYLRGQAARMAAFEAQACRRARHVIAVSDADERLMRKRFGASSVTAIPTGVDLDHQAPPPDHAPGAELVFVGSLDWLPNIDGLKWFVAEALPVIRAKLPECRLAIVGKNPGPAIQALASAAPGITIHGNVPDVRPYLWGAKIAIVPLHVGGGTRLKIYEAMAAGVPQVSTTIGAEGLEVAHARNILLADDAPAFAQSCLRLLDDEAEWTALRASALALVRERYGWPKVADVFEKILDASRR